jgi:hypothetical protein
MALGAGSVGGDAMEARAVRPDEEDAVSRTADPLERDPGLAVANREILGRPWRRRCLGGDRRGGCVEDP